MYTWRLLLQKSGMRTRVNVRARSGEEAAALLDPHWDDWAVVEMRRIQ